MLRKPKPYKSLSDEKLAILVAKNNVQAFNEIYSRYKNRLLYYFYRMLNNDQEKAQDFLQEIFMKFIEKPDLFNPGKVFRTWIFCVAHNMCKNEYRRMAVRSIIDYDQEPDLYCQVMETENETEKMVKKIYQELEKFDEDHRSVFLLRYREGFQINEIAEIISISQGTIKSRLFYTRKKLREQLKNCFEPQLLEVI